MELPDIGLMAKGLGFGDRSGAYPAGLEALDPPALAALGEAFLRTTSTASWAARSSPTRCRTTSSTSALSS